MATRCKFQSFRPRDVSENLEMLIEFGRPGEGEEVQVATAVVSEYLECLVRASIILAYSKVIIQASHHCDTWIHARSCKSFWLSQST